MALYSLSSNATLLLPAKQCFQHLFSDTLLPKLPAKIELHAHNIG
jgi:hypothetical protein